MTIQNIVETDVATATRDTAISDIVEQMADESVGSVVNNDDATPVGIVTGRKIALVLRETPDIVDHSALHVECMTS